MTKIKLYYLSALFSALLLPFSILIGCSAEPVDKVVLKRSEKLSIKERLNWRKALEFPSHCENGIYEWDDESHPRLNFIDINTEKYLVRSYCSLKPNEVNLFLVDKKTPHEKPHLLELKIPVEAGNTNAEANWLEDDATEEDWALRAERIQLTEKYTSRTTSLVPGGMFVNDQGQLVIHKSSIASGKCGIRSLYDLSNNQAKLVSFRAQSSCMGSSDVSRWKIYDESDLIPTDK